MQSYRILGKKLGLKLLNVRKIRWKKFRFVYLRKTLFKFYQNPDPHISNADPKHWF
jgi:hypothetical protein